MLLLVDKTFSLFLVMLEFTVLNNAKLIDVIIMLDKEVDNHIYMVVHLENHVCILLKIMLMV